MKNFNYHDLNSAPEKSKPLLEESIKQMGTIPNLYAVMAESPEIFQAYKMIHGLFTSTSFTDEELTVVWQTINVEHSCHYCVPAHTAIAHSMNVNPKIIDALKTGSTLPTKKLQALREFTMAMVRDRGNVSDSQFQAFYDADYEPKHVLEVILGLSQKVISNYVNHVAKTPIDEMFQQYT